ncbi:MAG TPA: penicillin acylase family protein [Rudaea sp.]
MRKRRSWFKPLLAALAAIVVIGLVAAWLLLRASVPQLDGERRLAGLGANVTIERDALGVATVRGASRRDVAFGLGFVHAQERFFEMDLMRRSAAGELAELFGRLALDMDKQRRPFRMRARAVQALATLKDDETADLTAYSEGANAGIASLGARPWEYWLLGQRPAAWTPVDTLLAADAMFFDLNDSTNARELAFSRIHAALPESVYRFLSYSGGGWDAPLLGPPMPAPVPPPVADIDVRKLDAKLFEVPAPRSEPHTTPGSNSFAVGGALTDTHAALVANDMHLTLRAPNIWFRARLTYPNPRRNGENVDLIGVTLPGVPALVAGSNHHVAWAFTNSYGDWLDWVRVTLDDADKSRYRTAEGSDTLLQSEEVIKVHNAADEKIALRETRWGPIVAEDADGTPLALAWTALQGGGVGMELIHLDRVETVDEALDLANHANMPAQNFIAGDKAGNIGWTLTGRIPRRIGGYDPLLPSDWSRPGTGWDGWIDAKDYPRLPNPAGNRLWTANARTLDFDSEDYKRVGDGGYDLGARAGQIHTDLASKQTFTPPDLLQIQLDDRAVLMQQWHDRLMRVTKTAADGTTLAELRSATAAWGGHASVDSAAYRLVREFRNETIDTVMDGFGAAVRVKFPDFKMPRLSQAEHLVDAILDRRPEHLLPPAYKDWDDLLHQCAERVVARLAPKAGGLAARTWGEVNTARIRHPLSGALPGLDRVLDMPAQALPGDSNMPRVQGVSFGASERFAVEPGHEETGYFHMPGGQSDHPLSPFYGAGHEDWVQGKPTPFLPGAAKYTLTLVPGR